MIYPPRCASDSPIEDCDMTPTDAERAEAAASGAAGAGQKPIEPQKPGPAVTPGQLRAAARVADFQVRRLQTRRKPQT